MYTSYSSLRSSDFDQYLEAHGMECQTIAYTPCKYSVVERKNCTLLNATKCLLHGSVIKTLLG